MIFFLVKSHKSNQLLAHENTAIVMVENYIKSIHEFHNKQKALRLRRNLDSQNFFRLSKSIKGVESAQLNPTQDRLSPIGTREARRIQKDKQSQNVKFFDAQEEEEQQASMGYDLSAEELKVFKDEGVRIFDEMNSMASEVK